MSKGAYIGVNGVARKMKGGYVGVNGVARKAKKAYVGDASGKARLWWEPEPGYLTFSSPSTFTISVANPGWDGTMQYSIGADTWVTWNGAAISGTKVYIRGKGNTKFSQQGSGFTITGSNVACTGNIETLIDYTIVKAGGHPTMDNYCFSGMFNGCTSLTTAPKLPATTLTYGCYLSMFQGCTALTTAPSLPATTLATECYAYMFQGCTALTTAPSLPATTLADYCYAEMFYDCAKLTRIPKLPATTLAVGCYFEMFMGCTNIKLSTKMSTSTSVSYEKYYRIPYIGGGTTAADALTNMFANTGGYFTGTPEINTEYYLATSNAIV